MKISNQKKNRRQRAYRKEIERIKPVWALCPNGCGEVGPHFVLPSLGDPGFFMCTKLAPEDSTDVPLDERDEDRDAEETHHTGAG